MNMTQMIKASRNLVKYSALGLAAAAMFCVESARAATITNTFDLGSGMSIEQLSFTNWIAKGTLPLGSILRSVSVDAVLESTDNWNWADDLTIYIDPTPETPGGDGLLQIGGYYELGSPALRVAWSNGQTDPVSPVTDMKFAGVDFPDNIDLSTVGLFLANGYGEAGYYGVWSGTVTVEYYGPASIVSFGPGAVIDQGAKAIAWTVPFGSSMTLSPTYTLSTGTCDKDSGSAQDFSSPVTYTVVSPDNLITNDYTVTITVTPASKECDIQAFGPGAVIDQAARTIVWYVKAGADLATLAPTYTLSPFATCPQPNGGIPTPDFSAAPVTYIVHAQAGGTKQYTVTIDYSQLPIRSGLACWFDAGKGITEDENGVLSWNDQSGLEHHATRASGTVTLVPGDVNALPSVHLRGNQSYLDCTTVPFASIVKEQYVVVRSPNATWNGSGAFFGRMGTGNSGARYSSYNMDAGYTGFWQDHFPTAVSKNGVPVSSDALPGVGNPPRFNFDTILNWMIVKIVVDNDGVGNIADYPYYHIGRNDNLGTMDFDVAEIIGYDHTLSPEEEAKLGGFLANKYGLVTAYPDETPQAQIRSFGFPGALAATINEVEKTISFIAPSTANMTALAPVFTVSSNATCDHVSGTAYDFSSPVHYIVNNGTVTRDYTVTATSVVPSGIINMNIDYVTWPGLVGPAGGLGTTWNTSSTFSGSGLLDSTGFATGVGYTSSASIWGGPDQWNYPSLLMLLRGLRNFDISESNGQQLIITGLAVNKRYDLYIASANCSDQNSKGVWTTLNDTTTPGDHPCDNTGGINGDTWVEGNNYVAFKDVKPDGSGQIIVNGHSLDGYRLPLNGFQIVKLPPKGTVLILW